MSHKEELLIISNLSENMVTNSFWRSLGSFVQIQLTVTEVIQLGFLVGLPSEIVCSTRRWFVECQMKKN